MLAQRMKVGGIFLKKNLVFGYKTLRDETAERKKTRRERERKKK